MIFLYFIFSFVIFLPCNLMAQGTLNDLETKQYKSFLIDMRKTDQKKVFIDYRDDRDTKYRKLRDSIAFEEEKALVATRSYWGERAIEWDRRQADRWDTQSFLINKSYSGTDTESRRARYTLRSGFSGKKK